MSEYNELAANIANRVCSKEISCTECGLVGRCHVYNAIMEPLAANEAELVSLRGKLARAMEAIPHSCGYGPCPEPYVNTPCPEHCSDCADCWREYIGGGE